MSSFSVGSFRFDVLSHERIAVGGGVRERFVVDLFHLDQPLSWHPNQSGRDDFSGIPNRQTFEWVGRESLDVYENRGTEAKPRMVKVGTKRGADYRTRFFTSLIHHAEKAQVAAQAGKRIGEVRDAEMVKAAFAVPVDLKALSLDEAATRLTRAE